MTSQECRLSELHAVCASGDADSLQEMMSSGKYEHLLDYKDPDWDERAPLHWCCMKGRGDMVRILLEKGAHPGIRTTHGWTPVHFAAECGRSHILRALHQFNAPMNRKDKSGDSPRNLAIIYGHKEAAEFLATAESDYVTRRRKLELSGQAAPHDDEDVDWCRQNKITPDVYVTEAELTELRLQNAKPSPPPGSLAVSKQQPKRKLSRQRSQSKQQQNSGGKTDEKSRPEDKKASSSSGAATAPTKATKSAVPAISQRRRQAVLKEKKAIAPTVTVSAVRKK